MSLGDRKSHAIAENNGEEVGNRIGACRSHHIEESEGPDFAIESIAKITRDYKRFHKSIGAIVLDACDNNTASALLRKCKDLGEFSGKSTMMK